MEGGVFGSKQIVACSSCGQELRKDTVERHWKTKHPMQKLEAGQSKWKCKTKHGQSSLLTLGFKAVTNVEEELPRLAVDEEMDIDEDVDHQTRRFEEIDENDNITTNKAKISDYNSVEHKIDIIAKDVKEIKDIMNRSETRKESQITVNTLEKDSTEDILKTCRTKEGFDDKITLLRMIKEENVKPNQTGYFCEWCFDGTKPKFGIQQSGVFVFDQSKDDTTETNCLRNSKISRNMLNLTLKVNFTCRKLIFLKLRIKGMKRERAGLRQLVSMCSELGIMLSSRQGAELTLSKTF